MTRLLTVILGIAVLGFSVAAQGQNLGLSPTYGSVNLSAGFTSDPYSVRVYTGGGIDARQTLGGNCRGMIANPPDFQLVYDANRYAPLFIFVLSGSDTTLVINDPDGNWRCDDDGMGNVNPLVSYANPPSGRYDIWVGTLWSSAEQSLATLFISELTP
jgi:hypothetical protein